MRALAPHEGPAESSDQSAQAGRCDTCLVRHLITKQAPRIGESYLKDCADALLFVASIPTGTRNRAAMFSRKVTRRPFQISNSPLRPQIDLNPWSG